MATGATLTVGKAGVSLAVADINQGWKTDLAFPRGTTQAKVQRLLADCGYICIGSRMGKGSSISYAYIKDRNAGQVGNGHQYGA